MSHAWIHVPSDLLIRIDEKLGTIDGGMHPERARLRALLAAAASDPNTVFTDARCGCDSWLCPICWEDVSGQDESEDTRAGSPV